MHTKTFKWFAVILIVAVWVLVFCATTKVMSAQPTDSVTKVVVEEVVKEKTFEDIHNDVKQVFLEVTGRYVTTQHTPIQVWPQGSNIIAYCLPGDANYPRYITFNHALLNQYDNEVKFQVILHEYVHCEYRVGHIQVPGSFMNDGGNPKLTKETTIAQFKLWHEYYVKLYSLYLKTDRNRR